MFRQGGKETKRRILNGFIVKERTSRVGGSWIEMREKILTLWRKFNFHRQFFRSGVKFMPKFALLKFVIQCVAECSVEWKLFSVSDDESRKTITILLIEHCWNCKNLHRKRIEPCQRVWLFNHSSLHLSDVERIQIMKQAFLSSPSAFVWRKTAWN